MDTTNTETTIHSLAAEMASFFESKTRSNGEMFLSLKDDRPDWMQDVCQQSHDSPIIGLIMPDDYRYEMINECLDAIADCASEQELEEAKYNLSAPDYTHDLIEWLGSHNARAEFCDAYRKEMGSEADLIGQIRDGYTMELWEVFDLVVDALNR